MPTPSTVPWGVILYSPQPKYFWKYLNFFQLKRLQVGVARDGKQYKKANFEKNLYDVGRSHPRSRQFSELVAGTGLDGWSVVLAWGRFCTPYQERQERLQKKHLCHNEETVRENGLPFLFQSINFLPQKIQMDLSTTAFKSTRSSPVLSTSYLTERLLNSHSVSPYRKKWSTNTLTLRRPIYSYTSQILTVTDPFSHFQAKPLLFGSL